MSEEVEVALTGTKYFLNLDAALDFCKWVRPTSFSIQVLHNGTCELTYSGSEGRL